MNEDNSNDTSADEEETHVNMPAVSQGLPGRVEELPALNVRADWLPTPRTFDQALRFAEMIATSRTVPKEFINSPGDILIAVQMGADVGLSWAQALQNIAVINGRPSMWGDAVLAVVRSSGLLEDFEEWMSEDGKAACCRVKRRGEARAVERSFSMSDAQTAGLKDKTGPWKTYPSRMLQMRARSWALRDVFGDVLKGLSVREEAMDEDPIEGQIAGQAPRSSVSARLTGKIGHDNEGGRKEEDQEPVTATRVAAAIALISRRSEIPAVAAMLNRLEDKDAKLSLGRELSKRGRELAADSPPND